MLFSPFGLPRLWRHTSVSVASSEHVVIMTCIHFNSMKYWQSWSGRNRNYGNRKWTLVGSHTLLLVLSKERGFWRLISCNHNCQCPLPLHKQVSSEQGCDCLRRSLIYFQISIYIYIIYKLNKYIYIAMQYVWSFCYGIVCYNPFLTFLDTSDHFSCPISPLWHSTWTHELLTKRDNSTLYCAKIPWQFISVQTFTCISRGHLCKQHLSCWIRIC